MLPGVADVRWIPDTYARGTLPDDLLVVGRVPRGQALFLTTG